MPPKRVTSCFAWKWKSEMIFYPSVHKFKVLPPNTLLKYIRGKPMLLEKYILRAVSMRNFIAQLLRLSH